MYLTTQLYRYTPCVAPSPTKSHPPLLDSFCPLRNYRDITLKWSPSGYLTPSYLYSRLDCATMFEKVSQRPFYHSHLNPIS